MSLAAGARRMNAYWRCARDLSPTVRDRWTLLWRLTKNLRVRLGLASHSQALFAQRTTYGTLHLRDNFGDITNLVSLVWSNPYRARELGGDGVILDAGANIGLAAGLFAHFNPGREIHCFEPLPEAARLIAHNCPAAQVHAVALGAVAGRVDLAVDPDGVIASRDPTPWQSKERTFPVVRLDDFVHEQEIERVALLKIDVEGMELEILEGSTRTLERTGEVVMETHGRERHEEACRVLTGAGFDLDEAGFGDQTGLLHASRSRRPSG